MDLGDVPGVPALPERFVAVKFYSGKAIPATERNRQLLRGLVQRMAAESPVVSLDTGLAVDEHQDLIFDGIPGVTHLASHLTPQRNLGVQAAVIQRACAYVGTCGGLAWLAPLLGTKTLAVYADDELLTPHLYAARQVYRAIDAAPFTPLDLGAIDAAAFSLHAGPSTHAS
jgi:ADP-heptose:LPS heptosyltransferase